MQANDRAAHRRWVEQVKVEAIRNSPVLPPFWNPGVRLTLVHLFDRTCVDVDNLIKPVQDALEGVFYPDDSVVTDVDSHRRMLKDEPKDAARIPPLLLNAWTEALECVYVRVEDADLLEVYL